MRLGHAPSGILLELAVVRSMARAGMAEGFHQCHRSCSGLETPVGYRRSCKPFPRYVSVSVHSVLGRRMCSLVSSSSLVLSLLFGLGFPTSYLRLFAGYIVKSGTQGVNRCCSRRDSSVGRASD